jgi:hypothetical protein
VISAHYIRIRVTDRHELEVHLESAVSELQTVARLTGKHGILLTRHRAGEYSAALSSQVPYGLTKEVIQ